MNTVGSEKNLKSTRSELNNDLTIYQAAVSNQQKETQEILRLEVEILQLEEVQNLVNIVAEELQSKVHNQIAAVVTRCLSTVFGKSAYTFQINFAKKRGKTEAELIFCRDGNKIDPMTEAGGGVLDLASFALRVVSILTSIPKIRKLVVLDEPFRCLTIELRPIAMQLVQELSKELKIQFLIVSHFSPSDLFSLNEIGKVIKI